jgi:hypothetical protein
VDYAANTLTLAQSVSFSAGQGLALDYQGTAPDIGAVETDPRVAPLAPNGLRINHK